VLRIIFPLSLALAACAPPGCQEGGDASARRDVEILAEHDGPLGDAAAERLVRRGKRAVAVLETGLYNANARGRMRIIRALERADRVEAAPIFRHLARHDPDPEVRDVAQRAAGQAPSP
jgi:hypothetical protein